MASEAKWDWEITNKTSYWGSSLKDLWSYRQLIISQVRRDFLLNYQQTILGPVWILLQPIFTLVTFVAVFFKMVGISTGSVPAVLFYFSGIVLWGFFSDSFGSTSFTFKENAQLFSKIYFPRIIMPLSVIGTHFLRFLVQLVLLILIIIFFVLFQGFSFTWSIWVLTFPVAIFFVGLIGLSMGLFFSVLTAKYRDMINMVNLGLRLLMFVTPVIYPMGFVPENVRWLVQINPLSPWFELFRKALLGEGTVTVFTLTYSILFTLIAFSGSILLFNKQGDKLIEVV